MQNEPVSIAGIFISCWFFFSFKINLEHKTRTINIPIPCSHTSTVFVTSIMEKKVCDLLLELHLHADSTFISGVILGIDFIFLSLSEPIKWNK